MENGAYDDSAGYSAFCLIVSFELINGSITHALYQRKKSANTGQDLILRVAGRSQKDQLNHTNSAISPPGLTYFGCYRGGSADMCMVSLLRGSY